VPPEVERLRENLRGRQVGLSKALARLENDPCHDSHYRLQGVLHDKSAVCISVAAGGSRSRSSTRTPKAKPAP